jgi:hypothetical protein
MFPISFHKTRLPFMLFLAVQCLHSGVYAGTPADTGQPEINLQTLYNPSDSLAYDQIVARIPHNQAPIRSVALASLSIALHNAKQQAEISLCDGQWAPHGSVVFQQGPVMKRSSPDKNEMPSWHYNALRQPREFVCGTSSRAAFFLEMSRYLPAWIQIRPAGQFTAFRQGETVLLEQESIAIK